MIVVHYWSPHPCGGSYLEAAFYWTAMGRGAYAWFPCAPAKPAVDGGLSVGAPMWCDIDVP